MLFFLCEQTGSLVYLLQYKKEYVVGRKDCDILITNDQSISRKHAVLGVEANKVTLLDCGSRYNTFIDSDKIEANTKIKLMHGNIIRFGRLQSIYTFNERDIMTTTSSIKSKQKSILTSNINFLGGSIVQNWSTQCTHVTVEEIILTVKVLCAVINGTPIVKPKFWEDYVECVKKNVPAPNHDEYLPPCSEMILNLQNLSLKFQEERKSLFRNKIFVFSTEGEKSRMEDMIQLAGGEVVSFETHPITTSALKNASKQYLIIVNDSPSTNVLQDLVNYLNEQGKRAIPLQEIALAIITCSCEKDCNPNFDRKGTVFYSRTETQKATANILALETQSQNLMPAHSVKFETIIPPSLEFTENVVVTSTQNETNQQSVMDTHVAETIVQVKREGDSLDETVTPKKMKLEGPSVFNKTRAKKNIETEIEPTKDKEKPPGKSIFAFKNDTNQEPKNVVINPFAKKRKATQNEDENLPKRSTHFNDILTNTPSTSNSTVINPFALRSKTFESSQIVSSPQQKASSKRVENVASSTMNNNKGGNLQVDLSVIEKVDASLEKSCGWMSKSNCSGTNNKSELKENGFSNEIEEDLLKYIESFKNSVVIEKESEMVVKSHSVRDNNNDSTVVNHNLKNFKNFKKVSPLKIQTTIISEAKYMNVVCNEQCPNSVEESDSEANSDIDTQVNTTKRKGKRFAF